MFFTTKAVSAVPNSVNNIDTHVQNDKVAKAKSRVEPEVNALLDYEDDDDGFVASSILLEIKSSRNSNEAKPSEENIKGEAEVKNEDTPVFVEVNDENKKDNKDKPNKAVSAQAMLSCSDHCQEAVKLLESIMKGKKQVSTSNKDLHLVLKTLKCVSAEVEEAASAHMGSYNISVRKRKRVQEEDEYLMRNNPKQSRTNLDVHKSRFNCMDYVNNKRFYKDKTNKW